MTTDPRWAEAQKHEAEYWGNCLGMRAWGEFTKQEMYGREMGLFDDYGKDEVGNDMQGELDLRGRHVLDIGGGPVSMTLRCVNAGRLFVADPLSWPASALRRYENYGITFLQVPAEELPAPENDDSGRGLFDEVWMYNVLQHVDDPQKVLKNAISHIAPGGKFRIFEWIHIPADKCHPHVLTPAMLLNGLTGLRVDRIRIPRLKEFWSDANAFVGVFSP